MRPEARVYGEGIGEVEVAGERFDFLSVDEDFEPLDLRHVGFESCDDGIDGELFAGDAAGSGDGHGFGEIGDAGAVGEEIEGKRTASGGSVRVRRRRGRRAECRELVWRAATGSSESCRSTVTGAREPSLALAAQKNLAFTRGRWEAR